MNVDGIIAAIIPIVTAFEQLGVAYYLGGSVVSSVYGIPRATFDVDLVADLRPEQVLPFVKQLEADYYIDEEMIRDAIKHRSSFNVLYQASMLKVDVFLPKLRPFDQEEYRRAQRRHWSRKHGHSTWHQLKIPCFISWNGTGWAMRSQIVSGMTFSGSSKYGEKRLT